MRPQYRGQMDPVHPCRLIPTRHCPALLHSTCDEAREVMDRNNPKSTVEPITCARFEMSNERSYGFWVPEIIDGIQR